VREVEGDEAVGDGGFVSEQSSRGKPTRRYEAGGESPLFPADWAGRRVTPNTFFVCPRELDPWISRPRNGPEFLWDPRLPKEASIPFNPPVIPGHQISGFVRLFRIHVD
jgi:hypothetical protein